jgi:hypothetical protein
VVREEIKRVIALFTTEQKHGVLPRVHHRSSHEYLRVVTVRGEGKGETVVTTPDRLDRFSCFKWLHVRVS